MPNDGDSVPNSDHLLRYIDKKYVDSGTGVIDGNGFLARPNEGPPSSNWIECFDPPIENQLDNIRAVKRIRYEKRGQLVRINAGHTIKFVKDSAKGAAPLRFVHNPLPPMDGKLSDPSHVLMHGIPEGSSSEADLVKDLLRECIIDVFTPTLG